ncbi:MAG: ATP-binding protein, partial [Chitinophagales bacterium]
MNNPKAAHVRFSYTSLKPTAFGLTVLSAFFTFYNYFLLQGPEKWIILALTSFATTVYFALFLILRKENALYNYTSLLTGVIFILPYFNTLLHMWLYNDPLQTSNILLLHVGVGIIVIKRSWFAGIITITTLVWLIIAVQLGFSSEWGHYVFSLIAAIILAFIANSIIQLNFKNLEEARETEQQQNKELKVAKTELEKQSEELKTSLVKVEQAKEIALQASKAKENFLSTMSHELRTPLNAVIGLTNLLVENNPREDQLDDLETLQFSADNLLSLINDILDFSKIEAGKIQLEQVSFRPEKLLDNLQRSFQNKAQEKGIKLSFEIDQLPAEVLIGDPVRLTQIMNNLISNALKFTDKGTVKFNCKLIDTKEDHLILRWEVQDTGIGIPKEKQKAIFEAFEQADSNTTRKFGGTGLGLSITRKLVQLMGGELKVESEENKGALFYFTITLKLAKNQQDQTKVKIDDKKASSKSTQLPELPKNIKVLIVEDNEINIKVVSKILKNNGVAHEIVKDGSSACQLIQNKQYHLVLMDLQMPIMDGYEATKNIRAMDDEYFKNVPIIALTASVLLDVQEGVLEAGMNDYVSKPIEVNILLEKMIKVLAES